MERGDGHGGDVKVLWEVLLTPVSLSNFVEIKVYLYKSIENKKYC